MLLPFLLLLPFLPALLASPLFSRQFVLPVELDPFYKAPSNLASLAPGTIIRTRQVSVSAVVVARLDVTATQIYYRTTSQNGTAIGTVTTVIRRKKDVDTGKLATFLVAEDSVTLKCAPSYTIQSGASPESLIIVLDTIFLANLINQGWVVNVPDYEGPNSAFAVGRIAGRASIDSARAALNYKDIKWAANPKLTFSGYSGGGIAAAWTAALLPTYAPELNVVGISTGGTPANVTSTLTYVDGGLFSGFGIMGVVGLVNAYSELQALYDKVATKNGVATFKTARSQCSIPNVLSFLFKKLVGPDLQTLGDRVLYDPTVARIIAENVLGVVPAETPNVPVLAFHSTIDEIIPTAGSDAMVNSWCANGATKVQYYRIPAPNEHISLILTAQPAVIQFLRDRFDGKPWISQCNTQNANLPDVKLDMGPVITPAYNAAAGKVGSQVGDNGTIFKANLAKGVGI